MAMIFVVVNTACTPRLVTTNAQEALSNILAGDGDDYLLVMYHNRGKIYRTETRTSEEIFLANIKQERKYFMEETVLPK